MTPVVAPAGTCARICVAETISQAAAGTPWKATPVAARKFVPVMVTAWPMRVEAGVKLVTVGAAN
jgi:hypothetical protein